MNILVIDCAVSRLSVAVKSDDKMISEIYDIGMRQSEILVPVIQEVLNKINLQPSDLDYSALTIGPGSFTGLRLGISALKAIELAYNVPVYGISSLQVYGYPYLNMPFPVISCIDANKDKFYASMSYNGKTILKEGDWEVSELIDYTKDYKNIFIAGPDSLKLQKLLKTENNEIYVANTKSLTTESLFQITTKLIENGTEPLKDFDGPVYLRASEAELKLHSENK